MLEHKFNLMGSWFHGNVITIFHSSSTDTKTVVTLTQYNIYNNLYFGKTGGSETNTFDFYSYSIAEKNMIMIGIKEDWIP